MSEFFFNIDHGYLEALVRGFKTGLLTSTDYANLVQCETLEGKIYSFYLLFRLLDLKLHIQSTDYGNFLANEPGNITVQVIDERLKEKLVTEFTHLRNNSLDPLSTFLDYIT
jgi:V-type H+-transporting ATPase subunit d